MYVSSVLRQDVANLTELPFTLSRRSLRIFPPLGVEYKIRFSL